MRVKVLSGELAGRTLDVLGKEFSNYIVSVDGILLRVEATRCATACNPDIDKIIRLVRNQLPVEGSYDELVASIKEVISNAS